MPKWDKWEKLENSSCVTKSAMHYHTSSKPTEDIQRWYIKDGWSVSNFCHAKDKKANLGDPYTNAMDC